MGLGRFVEMCGDLCGDATHLLLKLGRGGGNGGVGVELSVVRVSDGRGDGGVVVARVTRDTLVGERERGVVSVGIVGWQGGFMVLVTVRVRVGRADLMGKRE